MDFVAVSATSSVTTNVGLLPPWIQTQREIEAIKNDPRLVEKIGNQLVRDVVKVEGGYMVITDLCEMRVDVVYLPPENPHLIGAPARFELVFHDPVYYSEQ